MRVVAIHSDSSAKRRPAWVTDLRGAAAGAYLMLGGLLIALSLTPDPAIHPLARLAGLIVGLGSCINAAGDL